MSLEAFAPAELPAVGAGLLMLGVAAWLLWLDFNHRVVRAAALFLSVRGLSNVLWQFALAPGVQPPDWMALDRLNLYLVAGSSLAAVNLAVALLDPLRTRRWSQRGVLVLAAASAAILLSIAWLMPRDVPAFAIAFPHPVVLASLARYPLYLLLALLLLRPGDSPQETQARALAGVAFALDPVFLASSAVAGYPLGIQGPARNLFGYTMGVMVTYGATLALASIFVLRLHGAGKAGWLARSDARRGLAMVGTAAASAGAVLATLVAAPGALLLVATLLDAVWTAALPLLFAMAVVQGHLLGIQRRVRRAIRGSTVATAFLAVFLAASQLGQAFAPPGAGPYVGLAGTAALVLAVGRLARLGDQFADHALGNRSEDAVRLDAYRAALQAELASGGDPTEASRKLRPLRAQLAISDRDHAVMDHLLRAGAGSAADALAPGQLFLGRYRVQRTLGQGGAARTYLCRDERVGRDVVVKALRAPQAGEEGLGALVREARAVGTLNDPNVVTLHDVEQVGAEAFVVMEHLPGGSLAQRLGAGPMEPRALSALARDLLAALEAVHGAGLVHRDVKPSNILFTADGRAKLADFGIAHIPGFETTVAGQDQVAAGTVRYMSPEQALGHPVTHRGDLYSAGVTLYEAYTGTPYLEPRPSESAVELQMRAAMVQGFDRALEPASMHAWFSRALQREPARRFRDAREMLDALPTPPA